MPADPQQLTPKLTKEETVALWHAINWMETCLAVSPVDDENRLAMEAESRRLKVAKQALRKVNAIRKAQRLTKEQK